MEENLGIESLDITIIVCKKKKIEMLLWKKKSVKRMKNQGENCGGPGWGVSKYLL